MASCDDSADLKVKVTKQPFSMLKFRDPESGMAYDQGPVYRPFHRNDTSDEEDEDEPPPQHNIDSERETRFVLQ